MLRSLLLSRVKNIEHGFTTKKTENGELESLQKRVFTAEQVHGADIQWIAGPPSKTPKCDGLGAQSKGQAIGIKTADCVPILFCAVNAQDEALAVMAVHAGWRGASQSIATQAFTSICNTASKESDYCHLMIALGPSIHRAAYEVGAEVISAFKRPHHAEVAGKFHLDLTTTIGNELIRAAHEQKVTLELEHLGHCTFENPDLFPSYRRDGKTGDRILSFVGLL